MYRKPWPIIILATIYFLAPFANIFGGALWSDAPFLNYLEALVLYPENRFKLINLTIPALVAGYAILKVKKWSYPVFLLMVMWVTVCSIYSFTQLPNASELILMLFLPVVFNVILTSFILLPSVRASYYDPRLRWWETKPRYQIETEVVTDQIDSSLQPTIKNVALGGLFIEAEEGFELDETPMKLRFIILDIEVTIQGRVVYQRPIKDRVVGMGIQFVAMCKEQTRMINQLVTTLKRADCPVTNPVPIWTEDLQQWLVSLWKKE